jgi:ribosome assembly protein 1
MIDSHDSLLDDDDDDDGFIAEVLGKVYGVIARRKGVIKSEEIKDGTTFYTIGARLPIIESFGFNDELMKKTSGIALPQLIFDGFEILFDQDPFWIPKTDEELEDFGSVADKENLARKYMDQVRKRKVNHLPFVFFFYRSSQFFFFFFLAY